LQRTPDFWWLIAALLQPNFDPGFNDAVKHSLAIEPAEKCPQEFMVILKRLPFVLVAQNRFNPFTNVELAKLHEIKRTFVARITTK
jgi:hypothetical protein